MDLAYLIVGIGKNVKNDFISFYEKTQASVYGLALSYTKDRHLAKEIAIETYRRVRILASEYDTDTNAHLWLLNIAKNLSINAHYSKDIKNNQKLDNLSKDLAYIIKDLKDERASILILKALTDLSFSEMAKLLWYYDISLKNEYKRAMKATKKKLKLREKEILALIANEVSMPKQIDLINSDRESLVKDLSHELQNLSLEEEIYLDPSKQADYLETIAKGEKRKKRAAYVSLAGITLALILLLSTIVYSVIKNYDNVKKSQEKSYGQTIGMVEYNNKLYYQNYKDGSKLYAYNLEKGSKEKIGDYPVKSLIIYKDELFFQSKDNNKVYKLSLEGGQATEITSQAVSSFLIDKDLLYYAASDRIIRADLDGENQEVLVQIEDNTIFLYSLALHNDKVYFSGGAGQGIYTINEEYKDLNILYFDSAYDLKTYGDYFIFSPIKYPQYSNKLYFLLRYDIDEGMYEEYSQNYVNSGAFCLYEEQIYFDAFVKGQTGIKEEKGIYIIDIHVKEERLIIERESTDIYVSETYIYSYNPKASNMFVAYKKSDPSKEIIIF